MSRYIGLITLISIFSFSLYSYFKSLAAHRSIFRLSEIKRKANSRNRLLKRYKDQESNILLINPEKDIEFYKSDREIDLREKADIHKTRLRKHGKSKLNGKLYFKGPKGGVFILNEKGNKKYI